MASTDLVSVASSSIGPVEEYCSKIENIVSTSSLFSTAIRVKATRPSEPIDGFRYRRFDTVLLSFGLLTVRFSWYSCCFRPSNVSPSLIRNKCGFPSPK
ncbi:unnamed protein product [Trifolium pratense]|uniref:Uncharacterized protein n=1 Tax=Trifolium pratense TaxID=57577 RepID=A0ACB0KQH7_TRIPR|nr:unnamed protein product [Trifolium pratense]